MSDTAPSPRKTPAPRGWFRRWTRRLGWLALALVVLHRPLFHYGVPLIAKFFAARQNLSLELELSGSIFTNLRIGNVRIAPNGRGPSPVEHIRIGEMRFDYSLPKLLREGTGEFVSSYEMHHADLAFVALPSRTMHEQHQKQSLANTLRTVLAQPAAYADRVWIEDFNIRVRSPENETVVSGFDFLLEPDKPGHLRVVRVAVPGLPEWQGIDAATSYTDRNLFIRKLALTPQLVVDEIVFDASHRREKKGRIAVAAHVFGGHLALQLDGHELAKAGEHLENSYATHLHGSAAGIDVPATLAYFRVPKMPIGQLAQLDFDLTGEPEMPQTWDGTLALRVAEVAAGPIAISPVEFSIRTKGGKSAVRASGIVGGNRAVLTAQAALPKTIDDFISSDVDATLVLSAPKLDEIGARFDPPLALAGDVGANAHVIMRAQRVSADIQIALEKTGFAAQTVEHGQITLHASRPLAAASPLAGLAADVKAKLQNVRAGTVALDSVQLAATAQEQQLALQSLEVVRGDNSVTAKGGYRLPDGFTDFANAPAEVQFAIHVPKLADFGLGADGKIVSGRLDGNGAIRMDKGLPAGSLTLDGGGFEFAGAKAERLATKINIANQQAVIDQLVLQLNDRDQLVLTGKAGMVAPFAYEGGVQFGVRDLAVFQALLESFGIKEKLAGSIALTWTGKSRRRSTRAM